MAPSSTAITGLLRQVVYYHLDNNSYENALFFAEKLAAQDPKASESTHLLSLCHFRLGDHRSAFDFSRASANRGSNLGTIWVFAQSCLYLERFRDGISVLEKTRDRWVNTSHLGKHTAVARSMCPDEATVLCLLGKLYRAYDDRKKAAECFENALKTNPFMFDAFQALCDLGVTVRAANIFRVNDTITQAFTQDLTAASADLKDSSAVNFLEPTTKKASARNVMEVADPFELSRVPGHHDTAFALSAGPAESEENDFMSKITAARTRLAHPTAGNGSIDVMETPTGPLPVVDAHAARTASNFAISDVPPAAPTRRTRTAPAPQAEGAFMEAPPPRMGYRLGAKRAVRSQDKGQEQPVETLPDQPSGLSRSSAVAAERKRTVSGHPVVSRQQSEEPITRRSARLNMFKPSAAKTNSGASTIGATATRELKKARPPISRAFRPGSSGSSVGRVVSGNRNPRQEEHSMDVDHAETSRVKEPPAVQAAVVKPPPPEPDHLKIEESLKWIMDLLRKTGTGYFAASQFRGHDAVQSYSSLPRSQQETPWVLAQVGKAHYEQAAYAEAEKYFRKLRVLAPSRMEDMEVYSTILWHLKRETDLSFLAHELIDSEWLAPQAWCTLGNAWSLAREPDQALRCFKRATQVDPKFAYAFTLQGHEHVANEEYEKALGAYRQAITADQRHYNAYYGMGKVHEKLGNYDKARIHFHTASMINPTNAVLICCVGSVLEKQKQMGLALQAFTKATELAPRAAQTRYQKARALLAVGQLEAAQKELLILKDLAPDEANVHFLLGKMYIRTGEKQSAVRHFTVALALDPKASPQVKEAIESIEDDQGMEDSLMT
ncbi:Protein bimA like protein [Verticillium longisporum]|uniref:Protein bimA like protein n=1 Tax=Verticillium longisporum TaxID=100787 RepID=A0A8I3A0J4_VERLO|nr:Protein bimA like protein [Verticillium longisporum]KAG7142911.1 Protein bimA like protein [Verticillium longisporum]